MKKSKDKNNKVNPQKGRFSKKSEPIFWYASKKKNLDNMKLLLSHPKVKAIIQETREFIKIPDNGLKNNQSTQWHTQDDIRCDEIMSSPDFIKQEEDIKNRFEKGKITRDQAKELLNTLYLKVPVNYLYSQIWKIIRQFNIPDNYEHPIYEYILYGKVTAPIANYSIGPFNPNERMSNVKRVPVTIYAKLTDKDLRDLKIQINQYFGKKRLTFIQDVANVDRDLKIEALFSEKNYDIAFGKEYKLSSEDIAERVLGDGKKKKEATNAKIRINKLRKIRFGKQ